MFCNVFAEFVNLHIWRQVNVHLCALMGSHCINLSCRCTWMGDDLYAGRVSVSNECRSKKVFMVKK